jgi:hypothetical protein
MSRNISLAIFAVLAVVLLGLVWLHTGRIVPPSGADAIWFHAGLLTLLIGRFIVEYRFTKPNDVFVNCMVVFASTSTLSAPPYAAWWELIRWGALTCGVVALILAWDPGREAKLAENRLRTIVYYVVTRLGRAEVIFSLVFVLALLSYFDFEAVETRIFVIAWGIFLLAAQLGVGRTGRFVFRGLGRNGRHIVGIAHSFLAPSIVFCRRLEGQKVSLHQVVGFTQSSMTDCHCVGLVIGERSSASETRIVVVLIHCTVAAAELNDRTLMVTMSDAELTAFAPPIEEKDLAALKTVIGTVADGTSISQVRFELFGTPSVSAGTLLRVESAKSHVFYQVFDGIVKEEIAVKDSTRAFVEGEAEQVGYWDPVRGGFETHDWVAQERAPVFAMGSEEPAPEYELKPNEISVGAIPKSNYSVNIDLSDLVLYHTSILGVTGSGKSFLTFSLIEEAAQRGIKTVCIDPTGDYQKYLTGAVILNGNGSIKAFLDSTEHMIGIIETASQAMNPIVQTMHASQKCLDWCKVNRGAEDILTPRPKVMVVLEEAHLLVPEWNFNPTQALQNNVNTTAQTVLQARKYGLGFLVVSQRTANVVKSVLNQCNTIFSFQAFDETGFDFLKNYMGAFHVRSLPNLKPRHGIVVGKASRSRRPVMVHFKHQDRRVQQHPAPEMPIINAATQDEMAQT